MRQPVGMGRPNAALVISVIALIIAMGGIGYGAATIGTRDIQARAVTTPKLHVNAVKTKKIMDEAVTGAKVNESTLGQVPYARTASELSAPEPYHEIGAPGEPAFQNGAENFGASFSTAAFFIDHEGVVHLKGTVTASTFSVIFTLPDGYRPSQQLFIPTQATSVASAIYIYPNGEVEVRGGPAATNNYALDTITFRAG
jgi:hypothetical protein